MTFCCPFLAGNTRKPRNTIKATKEVRRISSSQLAKRVTYRQNREKVARMQVTTSFGLPSQTRVLDSLSYFFITASRSSPVAEAGVFFLNRFMLSS